MLELSRRRFFKYLGQGAAALSVGLSGRKVWPQKSETQTPATGGSSMIRATREYEIFNPGEYHDWEKEMVEERMEQAKRGPQQGGGMPGRGPTVITEEEILEHNNKYDPYNPLFNDKEYAKKAGFPSVPAAPGFVGGGGGGVSGIPKDFADEFYFGNDGSNSQLWTRVFAGDTFTSEPEKSEFIDLTVPGSDLRHFKLGGSSKMYNQKGEQVGWGYGNTREAYRKLIYGPKKSYSENMTEWHEYVRPIHYTTLEEWEYIKELWDKEYIRGSQKLYWEDVNVGDEPAWACSDGPINYMNIINWHGRSGLALTRDTLKNHPELHIYDPNGQIFVTIARHYGNMNFPGVPMLFFNSTASLIIRRMLANYVGDAGLVTKLHHSMMQTFKEIQLPRPGGEYMDKVPYMKGKGCTEHGQEGDTVIAKGYVTDKYINDRGKHAIDITCWGETLDNLIVVVVGASAELPSKKG